MNKMNNNETFKARVRAHLGSGTGLILVRAADLLGAARDTAEVVAALLQLREIRAARLLFWSPGWGLAEGFPPYVPLSAAMEIARTGKVPNLSPDRVRGPILPPPKVLDDLPLPEAARRLLEDLERQEEGALWIFLVFLPEGQLTHPATVDHLLALARQAEVGRLRVIVFIGPADQLPSPLVPHAAVEDHPRPDRGQILREVVGVLQSNLDESPDFASPEWEAILGRAARILGGLTIPEVRQATAEALTLLWMAQRRERPSLSLEELIQGIPEDPEGFLRGLLEEKARLVRRVPALEWAWPEPAENLGGFSRLKRDLPGIAASFSEAAEALGIRPARGILLAGPPGTGKSLAARVVAGALGFPMFRLDIGSLFGPLLGQTEGAIREALAAAAAAAPCVLLVDEVDKGLGGILSGGERDGGTSHRVLGTLLTWLQEDRSPVLVVMTANRISGLPPELIDRMPYAYGVGLPGPAERQEILAIHLRRRGQALPPEALSRLAAEAEGRSGRSIEAAVEQGVLRTLAAGRLGDPEALEGAIREALRGARPVSEVMPDAVAALEEVARRFPMVNDTDVAEAAPAPRRPRRILTG